MINGRTSEVMQRLGTRDRKVEGAIDELFRRMDIFPEEMHALLFFIWEDAEEKGHEVGYDQGYDDGYEEGLTDGELDGD